MKIMLLCLSLSGGGTERVITNLANQLSKKNDITIVKLLKRANDYELDKSIATYDIDKADLSNKNPFVCKLKKLSLSRILTLKRLIVKEKPVVIISFLPLPSFYLMILKRTNRVVKKIPVILNERGDPNVTFKNKILYFIMKNLYKKADGFVFQTTDAQNYYKNIVNCHTTIIGNPLNENFIKSDYSHERKKIIVSVGRLENQKNHILLMKSFKIIHEKYSDYKLVIYGDGTLRQILEKYIHDNCLDNCVVLKGKCNCIQDEIYDAKIFVLSSDFEGMPNSLLEALALGIPCISTDCPIGGARMLIENGKNGTLVKVNDVNEMSRALEDLIINNDKSIIYSRNAIESVKKFYPQRVKDEWEKYINYILNKVK